MRIGDIYAERSERGAEGAELLSVTMTEGVKRRSDIEGKDNSSEDKGNYKVVCAGDMVYNSMRMWQGANGISPYNGIVSPAYTVLTPREKISNGFFAALFKTHVMISEFYRHSQGMTSDTWNLKYPQIETIKTYIPPYDEQNKISNFLELLNHKIDYQRRIVELLKKYKRGAINNIFNGHMLSSEEKETARECLLSEVASFHQGLTYTPGDVADSGCLVLRSSNIQNGRLAFKDNVFVNCAVSQTIAVKENDILMCVRNGSKHLVGKTAIIDQAYENMTWGAFMMVIRSKLSNSFVYHYLNSDSFYNQVFRDSGTATINQITKGTLNECKLILPSKEVQNKICGYLNLLESRLQKEEDILEELSLLKGSLLQQLFI